MTDIALNWHESHADIALDGADLLADDGLETAVICSLFVDRRAQAADEVPEGALSRGGFFGDAIAEIEGDRRGSRLWLLKRETRRPAVLEKARTYCEEALRWMIEDGIAARVVVETSFLEGREPGEPVLLIEIDIHRPSDALARYRYAFNWQAQLFSRMA